MTSTETEPTMTDHPDGITAEEAKTLYASLEHHPDYDSWSYTGDLDQGKALADRDCHVSAGKSVDGKSHVILFGNAADPTWEDCDAHGIHEDEEQAWRYALGALFGPPEHDEPAPVT